MNFYYLARNTLRESLREPLYFLLLFSCAGLIGIFPSISIFAFRNQVKMVIDSSMAATLLAVLVTAVLCSSQTVTREIENGTVTLLLSKPMPRSVFVLSKVAGILAALSIFVFVCACATLVTLRVAKDQFRLDYATLYSYFGLLAVSALIGGFRNYFSRKSFSSGAVAALAILIPFYTAAMHLVPVDGALSTPHLEIVPAFILILFAAWTMGAITVALSTRLGAVANFAVCSCLFFTGLVSDYLFGRLAAGNVLFAAVYAALPNWQLFWMADALASDKAIPAIYILWAFIYVLIYIGFLGFIAVQLFKTREISENIR